MSQQPKKTDKPGFLFDTRETVSQPPRRLPISQDKSKKVRKKPDVTVKDYVKRKIFLERRIAELQNAINVWVGPSARDVDGDVRYDKLNETELQNVKDLETKINGFRDELYQLNILMKKPGAAKKAEDQPAPLKKQKIDNAPLIPQPQEQIHLGDPDIEMKEQQQINLNALL